jgi:hypothetical protein
MDVMTVETPTRNLDVVCAAECAAKKLVTNSSPKLAEFCGLETSKVRKSKAGKGF